MKDAYCAYRDWDYGEFDIIVFESREEMEEFCEFNQDYQPFPTSVFTLKEAKDIFPSNEIIYIATEE